MATAIKPYDWALDDRALFYNHPRQKYLCPNRHECYQSRKPELENYVLCWKCERDLNPDYSYGITTKIKGLYIPISQCGIVIE